jgi:hypothetical protein
MFLSGISRRLVTICLVFFCVLSIFLLGVSASFATMPSRPTIPGTQAKVDGLFFYECGRDMPPQQDRVYKRMFSKSRTRNIAWELRLLHPKTPKKVDFRITAKYLKPGGLRIPHQSGHRFRLKAATQSGAIRPVIPEHSGHLFRSNPATLFHL